MPLNKLYRPFIIITDIILINIAFLIANLIRFGFVRYKIKEYIFFTIFITIIMVCCLYFLGLFYKKRYQLVDLFYKIGIAVSIACMLMATIAYFDWTFRLPRTIIGLIWILNIIILGGWHTIFRPKIEETINSIIVGTNVKQGILKKLDLKKNMHVIGFLDDKKSKLNNIPKLGKINDIIGVIEKYKINQVIIALPQKMHEKVLDLVLKCYDLRVKFFTMPDLYEFVLAGKLTGEGLVELNFRPVNTFNRVVKRAVDFFGSIFLIILLSPLMIIIAILVKLTSPGPTFYKQKRLTRYNKVFTLYKFRTMIKDAEKKTGPVISHDKKDPRLTKIGRFLRFSHLDELPQLFHILTGNMSFVGPRPERPELSKKFNKQIREWNKRLYIRPGLTGLAQIEKITGLDPKNKIKRDLYYIKNQSLLLDIKILLITVYQLFKGELVD